MTIGFTEQFDKIPISIQNLLKVAVSKINPTKIILFGSRARGDHRENSDYDLAFDFDLRQGSAWSRFVTSLEDRPLTLFKVDLVCMSELDSDYLEIIQRDGVLLYERP